MMQLITGSVADKDLRFTADGGVLILKYSLDLCVFGRVTVHAN